MQKFYFSSINLGCTKNLVDTQYLLGNILTQANNNPNYDIKYFSNPEEKEVSFVFLNTCGFIKSWRNEMFQTIQKLLSQNKKIYLLWCWLQYFQKITNFASFGKSLPLAKAGEVSDRTEDYLRKETFSNPNIFGISRDDIDTISLQKLINWYNSQSYWDFHNINSPRAFTNIDLWFEYCKIAEWCNNSCSFCIIPKIRGKQKSKPVEEILSEIQNIIQQWAKEVIIIAQDTTRYGIDLYQKPYLIDLLKKINWLDWDFVFRVLYLYPDIMTQSWLEELTKLEKFVPYFDIPLQHISSWLLKSMWRYYDTEKIYTFLDKIKQLFPISYIRTNFIIWFPWETENNVLELQNFIKKWFFDNIALFEYHDEPFAASSKLPNKVPDQQISQRFFLIKKEREKVSKKQKNKNFNYINKEDWQKYSRGYISNWDEQNVEVRPWLNCPDIDETIKIPLSEIYQIDEDFEVGCRVGW